MVGVRGQVGDHGLVSVCHQRIKSNTTLVAPKSNSTNSRSRISPHSRSLMNSSMSFVFHRLRRGILSSLLYRKRVGNSSEMAAAKTYFSVPLEGATRVP